MHVKYDKLLGSSHKQANYIDEVYRDLSLRGMDPV